MPYLINRSHYAEIYGPTIGDKVRLGDTGLWLEVEKDFAVFGDECKFGGGKVLREGMGQAVGVSQDDALDLVITNALIVDYTGIIKADVGIKNGLIVGIGKAGNPDVMEGVTPGMIFGVTTEAISGEGLILTAGGIDYARPLHLSAASVRRLGQRPYYNGWRRHRPGHWDLRYHMHARCIPFADDAPSH